MKGKRLEATKRVGCKRAEPRSSMKTRNKILFGVFGFELLFIAVMCVFFAKFQTIPDTLCTCVLGAGGVTELITGGISIAEVLKRSD